jgi:hypothetical protein
MTLSRFTDAVVQALRDKNFYAALAVSLTLPDICGKLSTPKTGSKARYVDWCRKYLQPKYTSMIAARPNPNGRGVLREERVFLSAEDAYAIRCAYLHAGTDDLTGQSVRKVVERIYVIEPPPNGNIIHRNMLNNRLQLQVDVFCMDICGGVEDWLKDVASDAEVQARIAQLIEIDQIGPRPNP